MFVTVTPVQNRAVQFYSSEEVCCLIDAWRGHKAMREGNAKAVKLEILDSEVMFN